MCRRWRRWRHYRRTYNRLVREHLDGGYRLNDRVLSEYRVRARLEALEAFRA